MVHESKNYKHAKIACFYEPHDSLAMLGSPIGASVGLSQKQQTMLDVELSIMSDRVALDK